MLHYDRINVSKGIDVANSSNSKECTIWDYWFFNHGFQDSICNVRHDLTILYHNLSDTAIITIRNVFYLCIIHYINKSDAIHLLENSMLDDCGYI